MGSHPQWVRIIVAVLLLWTGADLVACDLLFPAACELAGSQDENGRNQPRPSDDCFCCCAHVVPAVPLDMKPDHRVSTAADAPEMRTPALAPSYIFHPPKL